MKRDLKEILRAVIEDLVVNLFDLDLEKSLKVAKKRIKALEKEAKELGVEYYRMLKELTRVRKLLLQKSPPVYPDAEMYNNEHEKTVYRYNGRPLPLASGGQAGIWWDVRNFVWEDFPEARKFVKQLKLIGKTMDDTALNCWDHQSRLMKYVFDENNQGFSEFWQFPVESLQHKKGDCEDGAFYVASMMRVAGIPAYRVRVALGTVKFSVKTIGHCWVEYLRDDGEWVVIESTLHPSTGVKKISSMKIARHDTRYTPVCFFNDQHAWKVREDHLGLNLLKEFKVVDNA